MRYLDHILELGIIFSKLILMYFLLNYFHKKFLYLNTNNVTKLSKNKMFKVIYIYIYTFKYKIAYLGH